MIILEVIGFQQLTYSTSLAMNSLVATLFFGRTPNRSADTFRDRRRDQPGPGYLRGTARRRQEMSTTGRPVK